jgi:LemA protein
MQRTIVAVVLASLLGGCGYNRMVTMKETIESSWAQVQNQLKRRNDLIPNLIEVTKGYAGHERQIYEHIADARARLLAGGTRAEEIDAATQLSSALGRLLAIAEQYPNLKADAQFAKLSDELAGTENRIAVERMRYNDSVRAYNAYVKSFPVVLYAGTLGFAPEKYFGVPEEEQKVPKVDFGTREAPKAP